MTATIRPRRSAFMPGSVGLTLAERSGTARARSERAPRNRSSCRAGHPVKRATAMTATAAVASPPPAPAVGPGGGGGGVGAHPGSTTQVRSTMPLSLVILAPVLRPVPSGVNPEPPPPRPEGDRCSRAPVWRTRTAKNRACARDHAPTTDEGSGGARWNRTTDLILIRDAL